MRTECCLNPYACLTDVDHPLHQIELQGAPQLCGHSMPFPGMPLQCWCNRMQSHLSIIATDAKCTLCRLTLNICHRLQYQHADRHNTMNTNGATRMAQTAAREETFQQQSRKICYKNGLTAASEETATIRQEVRTRVSTSFWAGRVGFRSVAWMTASVASCLRCVQTALRGVRSKRTSANLTPPTRYAPLRSGSSSATLDSKVIPSTPTGRSICCGCRLSNSLHSDTQGRQLSEVL